MQASVMVISGAAFVLLLFVLIGGPMLLVDWFRERRRQEIARQIALTEAIDEQVGVIVAPVVRRPLFGLWEIQIAVPFHLSATLARILSVVDQVFSDVEGSGPHPYRVFLSAKPDSLRETPSPRVPQSVRRWADSPITAA
jgi:hypothetical protein